MKKIIFTIACFFTSLSLYTTELAHVPKDYSFFPEVFEFNSSLIQDDVHETRFWWSNGDYLYGTIADMEKSFVKQFILKDCYHTTYTRAVRHQLFPQDDPLLMIRDHKSYVIGYLQVINSKPKHLFKRLATILYASDGTPLLKTEFDYPLRNSTFYPYLGDQKALLRLENTGLVMKMKMKDLSFFEQNIPVNLFLTTLQIHSSGKVLLDLSKFGFTNSGPIHLSNLQKITLLSHEKSLTKQDFAFLPVEEQASPAAWKDLKNLLEETLDSIDLSQSDISDMISDLQHRFTDDSGSASAESILAHLDELTLEEKALILDLIKQRLPEESE